jgi:hypothetical protein
VSLVVQLQAMLCGKALLTELTKMRFGLGLMRLMVKNDLLLLLWLLLLLLNDNSLSDWRLLARNGRVDYRLLPLNLNFLMLLLMMLKHRWRNALNLLNHLLTISLRDNLHGNWR